METNLQKKVVYLIGAGATHAEGKYKSSEAPCLLMGDIQGWPGVSSRIIEKVKRNRSINHPLINTLDEIRRLEESRNFDIEKVISLLSNTNFPEDLKISEKLKNYYYKDILENLIKINILNNPELITGLFELHHIKEFKKYEDLLGIICLNHDNLLQIASKKVYKGINLGFEFKSSFLRKNDTAPLIIKLHGCFSWVQDRKAFINVVEIKKPTRTKDEILWIPPSIVKESKAYPFNKLVALAYELLEKCDVLRIIGCSLSQNDWNIISLLFNAQNIQNKKHGRCFNIELILQPKTCTTIVENYTYLNNLIPLGKLQEGLFEGVENIPNLNPFHFWLKEKIQYHVMSSEITEDVLTNKLKSIGEFMPK